MSCHHLALVGQDGAVTVQLLDRNMYSVSGAADLLGLRSDRVRAWLDGYVRNDVSYPPVIRVEHSGSDFVTWGEFVELGFLREYRKAGVSLQHIRPVIERLRDNYGTPYPLAHHRPYIADKQLVLEIQEATNLDPRLAVVVRTGQTMMLSGPAERFFRKVSFEGGDVASLLLPAGSTSPVRIDPERAFGLPSVQGVATERLYELSEAGDSIDYIAEVYGLPLEEVRAAVAYEEQFRSIAA